MNLTVSPIPYGLRREEVLFEVVNSLQQLEIIIETVFQSIDQKVLSFGPFLSDINVRTTNCDIKLRQLKTWGTRATKVFSSHKYPKTELSNNKTVLRSVSNEIVDQIQNKHSYQSTDLNNNKKRFGQQIPFDDQAIDSKIQFFRIGFNSRVNEHFNSISVIKEIFYFSDQIR